MKLVINTLILVNALSLKSFTATAGIAAASVVGTGHAATDRALQIEPNYEYGDKRDLKHVIILMQENRSFDSYFGTMPGARGFADRYPVKQQHLKTTSGDPQSVFLQSQNGSADHQGDQEFIFLFDKPIRNF